ncbi:MAG: 2-succinyl-6-hydroxy-2,4-cyclohexadiene-1-carboxylate synthase [Haliscomenobacter sp.]|jgi:pimeloyl-ACP methyl ester carboxylesterase|nr:2-succinyl-6-hydroxy-2,4-cyclohexadiene-1-carboxylate synthase [Haliscomenobacter sp.]
MNSHFIELPSGKVFYRKWGEGKQLLIGLHGFETDSRCFQSLSDHLPPHQRLVVPDLPWHGQTQWQDPVFSPAHLKVLTEGILAQEGASRFAAIGYSLGARLWLSAAPLFASQWTGLILLAPEGLASRWQWLTEPAPSLLRSLGNLLIQHPERTLQAAHWAARIGALHSYGNQFLQRNLKTPESRLRLVQSWDTAAAFPVRKRALARWFRENPHWTLDVVAGTKDPLLRLEKLRKWAARIPQARFWEVDAGHQVMQKSGAWAGVFSRRNE